MAGQASKSSLVFGEDVPASFHYAVARKKRLCLLSEVVLCTVRRRLTSTFAIFFAFQKCFSVIAFISFRLSRIFAKKMAAGIFNATRHSEWYFEVKNSEFRCEMNF